MKVRKRTKQRKRFTKRILMSCVVMLLLFATVFTTTASAADLTWDENYEKTGYHLEKYGSAKACTHEADKCAYVVSKCTGLNPTKTQLKNSVTTSSSKLSVKSISVVSSNGTPGTGGSVSPYALQVTVENVNFRDRTYTIASPYADTNSGITGYNYIYMKFSWCTKTKTWYYVGAEHYWLGTVDGGVGTNEVHNTIYTHKPQQFIIVKNEYTIKFDGNNATSGSTAKMSGLEYDLSYTLTANGFKRTGYAFTGWNTKANGKGDTYKNKASVKNLTATNGGTVTLYAQWTPNEYAINFNGNGSTSGTTAKMTGLAYDTSYTLTANGFKKTGYTFTGWNTKADGSGTTYKDKASVKNLTATDNGTVTLYAQWKANTATIQYHSNGGKINNSPYYNQSGNVYYKLLSGLVYTSSTKNGTYEVKTSSLKYNAASMNLINVESFGITRTGYELVDGAEWIVGSADSGITVSQDTVTDTSEIAKVTSKIKNGSGTVTLYANWTSSIYKITLDNQNADSAGTDAYYEKYNVGNYTASDCKTAITKITVPKKTGYVFAGYYTEKDGKGTQYVKADGTITSTKTTFTKDTTLYARWNTESDVTYTINHWLMNVDGTEDSLNSDNYTLYESEERTGTTGDELTLSDLSGTYTGFTYKAGQVQGNTVTKANILADGSLMIDLYYARNEYTLTIVPNGGFWNNSWDETVLTLKYGEEREITAPESVSLDFIGWDLDGEGSILGTEEPNTGTGLLGTEFVMGYEDATLTAKWIPKNYTIQYKENAPKGSENGYVDENGTELIASNEVEGTVSDRKVKYGSEVTLAATEDGTEEAYTLTGWKRNL